MAVILPLCGMTLLQACGSAEKEQETGRSGADDTGEARPD